MSGGILGANRVSSGTGSWHPAGKLVKPLPMGSPSQDQDAGSNPAGATTKLVAFKIRSRFGGESTLEYVRVL